METIEYTEHLAWNAFNELRRFQESLVGDSRFMGNLTEDDVETLDKAFDILMNYRREK